MKIVDKFRVGSRNVAVCDGIGASNVSPGTKVSINDEIFVIVDREVSNSFTNQTVVFWELDNMPPLGECVILI